MAWWIWVLIAAGVIAIGTIKIVLFKKFMMKNKKKPTFSDED